MRVYNRLSRTHSELASGAALSGELLVLGHSSVDGVASTDAPLVDNGDDQCVVDQGDETLRIRVLQGDSVPSLESAVEIAEELATWEALGLGWRDAADATAPILSRSRVSELLERKPVEVAVGGRLPHLKQVFFAPATELRATPERVPVARARRISRRATQVLSARTQDWLRMSATGVTPRVIESMVRDEVVDLYENRVAARLLDSVGASLARSLVRLEELAELLGGDDHYLMGWWRKQQRLASLWGERALNDDHRAAVHLRRNELVKVLAQVVSMRGGPLYRGVPRRARVQYPIRVTNLLAEDPHYRAVRSVWAAWWQSRTQAAPPSERRAKRRTQSAAFDDFVLLLISRSLRTLEDPILAVQAAERESQGRRFGTRWGELSLGLTDVRVQGDWTLSRTRLTTDALQPCARLVTLPVELLEGSEASVSERLSVLRTGTAGFDTAGSETIVVYPGTAHALRVLPDEVAAEAYRNPLATLSHSRARTWLVPVSPLDIESQERLGRAIRWAVFAPLLTEYPVHVDFPPASRSTLGGVGFVEVGTLMSPVTLVRPASVEDLRRMEDQVRQEAHRLDATLQGGGHHAAASLRAAAERIRDGDSRTARVRACPVCQQTAGFEPRGAGTFECVCRCGTRWGLWHDALSNDRVPYLWVDDEPDGVDSTLRSRWLGVDVLAEPCVHPEVRYGSALINPGSGRCTEMGRWGSSCPRCKDVSTRVSKGSISRG